jgi:hypothetical protein
MNEHIIYLDISFIKVMHVFACKLYDPGIDRLSVYLLFILPDVSDRMIENTYIILYPYVYTSI